MLDSAMTLKKKRNSAERSFRENAEIVLNDRLGSITSYIEYRCDMLRFFNVWRNICFFFQYIDKYSLFLFIVSYTFILSQDWEKYVDDDNID